MKIISWNVNGIRAIFNKNFKNSMAALNADIICFQETKANVEQVKDIAMLFPDYHNASNSSKERKGYSGTSIWSKAKPISVSYDIGIQQHDQEGRVVTAEFDNYYVVNVYVPNSGEGLARLPYRKQWDMDFLAFLQRLETQKPVIVCGDFNVAHQPIDIARPKENYNKSAGYTQTEIDGFTGFMRHGFIDTFRHLHPTEIKYSWWSYRAGARRRTSAGESTIF
ncbi:MAG: exodeoxyribonuclease III [Cyclobacteriaceae bacterium]|nr:exodeoxyribonuclease III [Cyclobacteriaceae bacterium]